MLTGPTVLQGQKVGVGEIANVDVVPDAGAVRGGPVTAEDQDLRPPTGGDLQDQRNEVGLAGVPFPQTGVGPGDVEVAQTGRGQAVRGGVGGDRVVDRQFGGPVGVGRPGGRLLYCTCSIFRAEGAEQVETFLAHNTDALLLDSPGHLVRRTTPKSEMVLDNPKCDYDGFYYALLQRH